MNIRFNIYNRDEDFIDCFESGKNSEIISAVHNESANTLVLKIAGQNTNLQEGNMIGFLDLDNSFQLFEIKKHSVTHDKNGLLSEIFAEHVMYELLDEIVTDVNDNLNDAAEALQRALRTTRFSVGTIITTAYYKMIFNYETVITGLNKIKSVYDINLRFRLTTEDNKITGRYIDIVSSQPKENGKRFTFTKDLLSIKREIDTTRVLTALYGRGASVAVNQNSEQSSPANGERLNFISIDWRTPTNPINKPVNQEWVGDDTAKNLWGRGKTGQKRHRFGIIYFDGIKDPELLLNATYNELLKLNKPKVTYNLSAVDLERISNLPHEAVRLNDKVIVIDDSFNPVLQTEVKVLNIIRDLLNPKNTKIILGNDPPTLASIVRKLSANQQRLRDKESAYDIVAGHFDKDGNLDTSHLNGSIDALTHQIIASGAYQNATPIDGKGILFENTNQNSADYGALYLGPGVFAIANTKENGKWKWRTFGTGSGFSADLITAGKINAALIKTGILASNNGKSWMNMETGSFNFGDGALKFDGVGNADFSGYISSQKNGREVFINGSMGSFPVVGFEVNGDNTGYIYSSAFDKLTVYGAGRLELSAETALKITAPEIILNNNRTAYTGSVSISGKTMYFNNGILYNVV